MIKSNTLHFLIVLALSISACDSSSTKNITKQQQNPSRISLTQLSEITGLNFPASTQIIGIAAEAGLDSAVRAKLVMPDSDWTMFSTSNQLHNEDDYMEENRYLLAKAPSETDLTWWDPDVPARLPVAQFQLNDAKFLNIAYTKLNDKKVLVYIFWHST